MGRRKQAFPKWSHAVTTSKNCSVETELDKLKTSEPNLEDNEPCSIQSTYYVEVNRNSWGSNEHLDLSEVVLNDLNIGEGYQSFRIDENFYTDTKYSLRFRICNANSFVFHRIKLGHCPVFSSSDICLEFIEKCTVQSKEVQAVILSGSFDWPDDGIIGLVHLTSMKFFTVRPVLEYKCLDDKFSMRVRVEILKKAFDACASILDNTRQVWKKSMRNVMAWLRPELMTSDARYGHSESVKLDINLFEEMREDSSKSMRHMTFDVAEFYEAIKPSKSDPILVDDLPDLLAVLRPYQRRAVYWMVQREKFILNDSRGSDSSQFFSPLCMPVPFLDSCSKMSYNPFSGNVSLCLHIPSSYVLGGILADEMGLGKTVELLACIFAHRRSESVDSLMNTVWYDIEDQEVNWKRLRRERVECICGAVSESYKYSGLWVQCDICDAWQHADCVGYSPKGKKKRSMAKVQKYGKKTTINFVERDGNYVCQMCSESIPAADYPIATGATLIVCPASILPQWHAEISRHTRPGSLRTCIYEGVRDTSLSSAAIANISELIKADIVLTTYDVLKEDLSHDSDRHEGDRRTLRFQKRYPVIPTLLTRIFWWRVCLDEAQMVESSAAAATEMALRLSSKYRWCITGTPIQHKLDDLFGLLKFIKASPFNNYRWWVEVIRDPYERRDVRAMEFAHKFFKEIMWRSSKLLVADELKLPPQEECVTWLSFSAIEEHFYQRQHETCVSYAREVIECLKDDILKTKVPGYELSGASEDIYITHVESAKLLSSLLKLRQACCHPQVGSCGLRSIQHAPMTMEEILMVLVSKTKIEGEESLRKLVIALNALAGIAMIKQNFAEGMALYKEAMEISEEHSEDFSLDPLLNIHIHHNLAESFAKFSAKKQRSDIKENLHINGDAVGGVSCLTLTEESLRTVCETMKQKYVSSFNTKLHVAQHDLTKSSMQVHNAFHNREKECAIWWLEALLHAELNKDFGRDMIRKMEETISGTLNNSRSSRVAPHFRSITALKYYIQSRLEQLENSRKMLLDRLLDIDRTMENPREADIERMRCCQICHGIEGGQTCVHCELEELFKDYGARLFRHNTLHGEIITSAEETLNMHKQMSSLNRFYWNLSMPNSYSAQSVDGNEASKKRNVGERLVVSKSPSELEILLGVMKSCCKGFLGREGMTAASNQLHILEAMRKEYNHARSLAVVQAQLLRAHDEIKMAVSRLRLKEKENDSAIDSLDPHELDAAIVVHSNDKLIAMSSLSRMKGRLRYLKALVLSKQKKSASGSADDSAPTQQVNVTPRAMEMMTEDKLKDEDACPICQEKLNNQKMVFQCGHITCCKCICSTSSHINNIQQVE